MTVKHTPGPWVSHNPLTRSYETPDGTSVAEELADNAECVADVLRIAIIRGEQRAAINAVEEN